jgi:hypothetical protein
MVQGKPWLQIAKIAGRDLETLLLGDGASPPHPQAPRFIDDRAEGPGCAARFRLELGHHIVIGGERRRHERRGFSLRCQKGDDRLGEFSG